MGWIRRVLGHGNETSGGRTATSPDGGGVVLTDRVSDAIASLCEAVIPVTPVLDDVTMRAECERVPQAFRSRPPTAGSLGEIADIIRMNLERDAATPGFERFAVHVSGERAIVESHIAGSGDEPRHSPYPTVQEVGEPSRIRMYHVWRTSETLFLRAGPYVILSADTSSLPPIEERHPAASDELCARCGAQVATSTSAMYTEVSTPDSYQRYVALDEVVAGGSGFLCGCGAFSCGHCVVQELGTDRQRCLACGSSRIVLFDGLSSYARLERISRPAHLTD